MAHADFVHLRVHSAYSLSAGAIKVKQLVGLCKQQKMPAVAITDTGNLFGALEFAQACIDAGVQPVVGCELALRRAEPDFPNLKVIHFPRNGGAGTVRRIGSQQARGDIVVWTDADMTYPNERIPELAAILDEDPTIDQVVWSNARACFSRRMLLPMGDLGLAPYNGAKSMRMTQVIPRKT